MQFLCGETNFDLTNIPNIKNFCVSPETKSILTRNLLLIVKECTNKRQKQINMSRIILRLRTDSDNDLHRMTDLLAQYL